MHESNAQAAAAKDVITADEMEAAFLALQYAQPLLLSLWARRHAGAKVAEDSRLRFKPGRADLPLIIPK